MSFPLTTVYPHFWWINLLCRISKYIWSNNFFHTNQFVLFSLESIIAIFKIVIFCSYSLISSEIVSFLFFMKIINKTIAAIKIMPRIVKEIPNIIACLFFDCRTTCGNNVSDSKKSNDFEKYSENEKKLEKLKIFDCEKLFEFEKNSEFVKHIVFENTFEPENINEFEKTWEMLKPFEYENSIDSEKEAEDENSKELEKYADFEKPSDKEKTVESENISVLVNPTDDENSVDKENSCDWENPSDSVNFFDCENIAEYEKFDEYENWFVSVNKFDGVKIVVGSWMHFPFSIWNLNAHNSQIA